MTDIKLDIEVQGTRELRRAADELLRTGNVSRKLASEFSGTAASNMRLVKETRRLEAVQRQLNKAIKDDIITKNKATRVMNEEIRKSKEKILTDSTIIAQQKKAAKAAKELAAENERLVRAYAPAKVAADQFRESVKNIDKALARNLITAEEHTEAMRVLNFEFNQFTKGAATGGNQFAKFNVEAYKSAQTIKRQFNTGMQQAGYQVGDFFVQIQSGQSALVALGQQGSQLAGIFGPGGALVGAFLAIGTAIATIVVQAKKAEEALHSMKIGFQEATRGATEAIKQLRIENYQLTQNIENVTEAMLALATAEQEAAAKANDLRNETNFLGRTGLFEFGGGFTVAGFEIIKTDEEKLELLKEQRRVLLEQLETNKELLRQKEAEIRSINQRFKAEAQLFEMEVSQSAEVLALTAERAERERRATDERFKGEAAVFSQAVTISKELLKLTEERAQKEERAIDQRFKGEAAVFAQAVTISKELVALTEKRAEAERRSIDERFKGEAKVFSQAVTISRELLKLAEKKAETERRSVNERFEGEAAVFSQAVTVSNELLRRADELAERQRRAVDERFKGEAAVFSQAVAISSDVQALIDKRREKEQRALDERFKGEAEVFSQTVEVAEDLLDLIEQKAEDAARIVKAKFEAEDFLFRVRFADETALMQQEVEPAKKKKEREKTLKDINDTIRKLKEQTAQERKLLILTGERRKEEEIFYDLVLANRDADIKLSEKKLRAIAEEIAAQQEANEMYEKAIGFVDDISDAFSDFVASGLRDFKDFVSSIKDMFVRLLADMAAAAVRNRILIPIATGLSAGVGNAAAAQTMGSFGSGTFGSMLAGGASALGSGFMAGIQGFMGGGLSGYGATLSATALNAGPMATIGAALPAVLAVAAVVGLLTKKTKLLDSGLRATVEGFDVAIETFQLTQSSRLFGLLKGSKKTTFTAADAEVADPIIGAINKMQESIVDAAGTLGIGAEAFEHFTYQFKVSLKGLSEEEQLRKVNEEITKMGDAFAELSGHFSTMNELLQVAQQRYDLETRLLQLQGNATALLARQREREIASTHELNQGILAQIHAVEDAQLAAQQAAVAVDVAFATVQRSIQARKDVITRAFNDLMENIQLKIDEANENVSVSRSVLGLLESAASRGIGMTREAGMEYLRELRGASRISDQKKLDKALKAISDPSEDLYTNFVDYQRDFADQSNLVRDLEKTAKFQLSTDEQTLLELQEQADAAETRHQEQLDALDAQLDKAQEQINVMKGVDTSIKSVEQAIADLSTAIEAALSAQKAAKAAAGVKLGTGTDKSMAGVIQANVAGQKILEQIGQSGVAIRASDQAKFQKINIRGAEQLLEVANQLGVKTSGKSGAEIQQAISNAGNLGVNMDNATRAKEFALGGYFAGGLRMVGERGPELEMTGPSRIMSNNDTRRMLQNPDLVEAVKSMKQEISELRQEQRQLGINNNKYTKRTYDLYRQWDTEGLPAERT